MLISILLVLCFLGVLLLFIEMMTEGLAYNHVLFGGFVNWIKAEYLFGFVMALLLVAILLNRSRRKKAKTVPAAPPQNPMQAIDSAAKQSLGKQPAVEQAAVTSVVERPAVVNSEVEEILKLPRRKNPWLPKEAQKQISLADYVKRFEDAKYTPMQTYSWMIEEEHYTPGEVMAAFEQLGQKEVIMQGAAFGDTQVAYTLRTFRNEYFTGEDLLELEQLIYKK